jgi:hypothetical protein
MAYAPCTFVINGNVERKLRTKQRRQLMHSFVYNDLVQFCRFLTQNYRIASSSFHHLVACLPSLHCHLLGIAFLSFQAA